MIEIVKNWCNTHLNLLRFVLLIVFLLCCYTLWCRFTEDDISTAITDTSVTNTINQASATQSAITGGLEKSTTEAGAIGTEVHNLREQSKDAEGRIVEAGEIIAESQRIVSSLLQADESTNH